MIIVRGKERKRDACGEFRQMISLHEMIVLGGIVILIMFLSRTGSRVLSGSCREFYSIFLLIQFKFQSGKGGVTSITVSDSNTSDIHSNDLVV